MHTYLFQCIWLLPFVIVLFIFVSCRLRKQNIDDKTLNNITIAVLSLWLLLQIVSIVIYWGKPQYSDAGKYLELGESRLWYPVADQLNTESYIFNPCYVNFLIFFNRVTGSLNILPAVNIIFNIVLLYSVANIVNRITRSYRASMVAIIFFCMLPSNIQSVSLAMTELFFTTLVYFSIFTFRSDKAWYMLFSGITIAFANYVRPIAALFIVAMILYALVNHYRKSSMTIFGITYVLATISIAAFNYHNCGHTIVASSTGGVNLLIGANDDMNGTYTDEVFHKGHPGDVDERDLNVFSKDSLWKNEAMIWIKQHPYKYISYIPLKVMYLWVDDFYACNILEKKHFNGLWRVVYSIPYYIILIYSVIGIWRRRHDIFGVWGIYMIPLLGTCAMHALIYGSPRYHYPVMPIVILFATDAILNNIKKWKDVEIK